jgi:predicted P-loop ATPase
MNEGAAVAKLNWLSGCVTGETGKVVANLANALSALRALLPDCLGYDEMARCAILMKPLASDPKFYRRPLTDVDIGILQTHLQRNGLPRLPKDVMHQAADIRAHEESFHPLRAWLNNLVHDGKPRIRGGLHQGERVQPFLARYFGADATPYVAAIGTYFLIFMVARIYRPGCKGDYMLVLEGPQGSGKSTGCGKLGGEHFDDSLPELSAGKDVSQHLRNKWLIEVSEMHAMNKADTLQLKAFITRTVERYRPSYGRREVEEPRQCVFVGTTNATAYLKDPTGGRRFWPVKTRRVAIDALERDRDQIFAEAVQMFHAGEQWWPDREFETAHIAPEQAARYEADAWEEAIAKGIEGTRETSLLQLAKSALDIDKDKLTRGDQLRISAALKQFGWGEVRRSKGVRYWGPVTE